MIGETNANTTGRKPVWNCVEMSPNLFLCWGYGTITTQQYTVHSVKITLPVMDVNNGTGLFPQVTLLDNQSSWGSIFLMVDPSARTADGFYVNSWQTDPGTFTRDFSWMCVVMTA